MRSSSVSGSAGSGGLPSRSALGAPTASPSTHARARSGSGCLRRPVFAEVGAREGVARLGEDDVHVVRRQLEKRARRRGRDVSSVGATIFALRGGVLGQHLRGREHLAEAAVVGDPLARRSTQTIEQAPQQPRVSLVERGQRGGERVPALETPAERAILIDLEIGLGVERLLQLGLDRGQHQLVEIDHQELGVQRQRQELLVEVGELVGGEGLARLQHHLEPEAEARRIEALVGARRGAAPEILVEHLAELLGCRQRDDLAGVLEPDLIDELQERARWQRLHRAHEVRLVEDAREQRSRRHRQLVAHERTLVGSARAQ